MGDGGTSGSEMASKSWKASLGCQGVAVAVFVYGLLVLYGFALCYSYPVVGLSLLALLLGAPAVLIVRINRSHARHQAALREEERRIADRVATVRGPKPPHTLIRTFQDAERCAAEWMRWMGWADARVTPSGPDEGIDVISARAVGQVKAHVNPIGRPEIQQLHGVASHAGKKAVFFCLGGYTPAAVEWADRVGMSLFRFDLSGEPEPVNEPAKRLMTGTVEARH